MGDRIIRGLLEVVSVTRGPTIGQFTLGVVPTRELPDGSAVHLWRD